MAKRIAWVALRAEFVRRRLDGEAISLEQFAKARNIHPRTVEKRASKEAWFDEIDSRARERVQAVDDHSRRMVEQLRFYVNRDETATRREHAQAMQELIDLALKKMDRLDPDSLTIDQALAIMKFAPAAERLALGFPDTPGRFNNRTPTAMVDSPALRGFEENLKRRAKTQLALAELQQIVEGELAEKEKA